MSIKHYKTSQKETEILKKIDLIKKNIEKCYEKRIELKKEIEKKKHDFRRFGNYISRAEDDLDVLELKLRKIRESYET